MSYFEGYDKFGFPEDDPLMGDLSTTVGSMLPDSIGTTEGGWLMGGPNTGLDDVVGYAAFGMGLMMLNPVPVPAGHIATAALAVRLGLAASTGVIAYIVAGLAVTGAGYGLMALD